MKRGKTVVNTSISLEGRICCCKRSACRKKYCECYRLNKLCTAACKCVGCCNKELLFNDEGANFMNLSLDAPMVAQLDSSVVVPTTSPSPVFVPPLRLKAAPKKEPKKKIIKEQITKNPPVSIQKPQVPITVNCISSEVVDSVIKCMLAQAQECVDCRLNDWQTERMILDTFDSCLVDILRCMGIQAAAETEAETILGSLPAEAPETAADETTENAANGLEFSDLVESIESTTLDMASLSAGDDSNSTLFVFENDQVKNLQLSAAGNSGNLNKNVKPEPNVNNAAAATVPNLSFIDTVESGEFDFESFTKMCQENTDLLDLGNVNVNEAIQFVEDGSNLADSFEFSQI